MEFKLNLTGFHQFHFEHGDTSKHGIWYMDFYLTVCLHLSPTICLLKMSTMSTYETW